MDLERMRKLALVENERNVLREERIQLTTVQASTRYQSVQELPYVGGQATTAGWSRAEPGRLFTTGHLLIRA
jgi:hypothetical protein